MPVNYPTPHLLGRIAYSAGTSLRPDGDTVHLRDPVVLLNGQAIPSQNGQLKIWTTGALKPRIIQVKGQGSSSYVPVRFEGIDAPEEHYRSTPFTLKIGKKVHDFSLDPNVRRDDRAQPRWKPAADYTLSVLQEAGWALVMLDREVTDRYGRVLGYVYTSDAEGSKNNFLSEDLIQLGLAFPFLFESAGDIIPIFLKAAARAKAKKLGVWKHYNKHPLPYTKTYPAPKSHTDPEPPGQSEKGLNLPVVFRRVVDAHQIKGLSLKLALRKYDAMNYETGQVLPGDQYHKIPVDRLIWAPHTFK